MRHFCQGFCLLCAAVRLLDIPLLRSKHIADNEKMKMQSMPELSSVCATAVEASERADTHSKKSTMPQREVKVHHPFLHVISKSSSAFQEWRVVLGTTTHAMK